MDFISLWLVAPAAVFLLSILFSVLGLGGASIYVPLFIALGVPIESAVVGGLFVNIVTTAVSSFNFHRHGLLNRSDYRTAGFIFIGTLVGVPLGAVLAHIIDARVLVGVFALVLALAAVRMLRPPVRAKSGKKTAETAQQSGIFESTGERILSLALRRGAAGGIAEVGAPAASRIAAGASAPLSGAPAAFGSGASLGGGTGLLSGSLGIGGGVFLVPALVEGGLTPRRAAVLSHVCTLLASLLGLLINVALGSAISTGLLLSVGAAAAVGSAIGSLAMARGRVNDSMIRRAFVVLLALFALKMALDFIFWTGAPAVILD